MISFSVFAQPKPPAMAVASADPRATQAGIDILKKGGNAFDAAVAVSAVLAVVEPFHSGIGGGGFWLLHTANNGKNIFIDGREQAPMAAHEKMYQDEKGNVVEGLSLNGPLAAAIPGEPAAMAYIAKHYGNLPLSVDLAAAIALAEHGFKANLLYEQIVNVGDRVEVLNRYPSSRKIFLKNGKAPKQGDLIVQKDLAQTLRLFAEKGHDGFYKGEVAKKLVKSVREAGGIWTMNDLAQYQLKLRTPLVGHYKDSEIITAPPPSAGGIAILTMLNILSAYDLPKLSESSRLHYVIEAMRLAYWDRSQYLGDPDYVKVPVQKLTSMAHANQLRRFIQKDKATSSASLSAKGLVFEDSSPNTTHFSIIDGQGNRVAATLSVNYLFGSSFVADGTGVLLNDEMDDFSSKPGAANVFGLVGHSANQIEGGKRPLSSMAPTFLVSKKRVGIIGTPGGSRIPTMILWGILEYAQGKPPLAWVSKPRIHHQYLPDVVQMEPDALSADMQKQLLAMGYHLLQLAKVFGDMQAVEWDKSSNKVFAASDPRHVGLAEVIPTH